MLCLIVVHFSLYAIHLVHSWMDDMRADEKASRRAYLEFVISIDLVLHEQ